MTHAIALKTVTTGAHDILQGDGSGRALVSAIGQLATTVALYHKVMTLANTEYSQALPANTKKFTIRCIEPVVVGATPSAGPAFRLAYVTGKVATPTAPFRTIDSSVVKSEDNLNLAAATLYFACAVAGKVIEIEAWS